MLAVLVGLILPMALWKWSPPPITAPTVQMTEIKPAPPLSVMKPMQQKEQVVKSKIEQQQKLRFFW